MERVIRVTCLPRVSLQLTPPLLIDSAATPFADRQTDAGNDEFEPAAAHHSWRTRHGDAHVCVTSAVSRRHSVCALQCYCKFPDGPLHRYPVDLLRALKMSAAAEGRGGGAVQLVKEFHAVHGLKGFATQGVLPEMMRATYMRGMSVAPECMRMRCTWHLAGS